MTARSRQAHAFAWELPERAGVRATIESTSRGRWLVQWPHGPTVDQMRGLARELLPRCPDMAEQGLEWARGWAPRAWAARAVAAEREGTLRPAVEQGAAWHRQDPAGICSDLTEEAFALLAYVEDLIDTTPDYAKSASTPGPGFPSTGSWTSNPRPRSPSSPSAAKSTSWEPRYEPGTR